MVSVIVPNYNHSLYLRERIDSVLNQTYRDFEVIILDDCSTDNSSDIIESYRSHTKIGQIIFNEHNSGSTFIQWKRGLELAQGEWIWIAESDDWCVPHFLERMVGFIDNHPELGLCYSNSKLVDSDNNEIYTHFWSDLLNAKDFSLDYVREKQMEFADHLIFQNNILNASAVVVRKEVLKKYINQIEQFRMYGDWLIWSQIAMECKIGFVAEKLNYFRTHNNNVRTKLKERYQLQEQLQLFKIFEALINKLPLSKRKKLNSFNKKRISRVKDALFVYSIKNRDISILKRYFFRVLMNPRNLIAVIR